MNWLCFLGILHWLQTVVTSYSCTCCMLKITLYLVNIFVITVVTQLLYLPFTITVVVYVEQHTSYTLICVELTKYTQLASTDTDKCTIIFDSCCTVHAPDVCFISMGFGETGTYCRMSSRCEKVMPSCLTSVEFVCKTDSSEAMPSYLPCLKQRNERV